MMPSIPLSSLYQLISFDDIEYSHTGRLKTTWTFRDKIDKLTDYRKLLLRVMSLFTSASESEDDSSRRLDETRRLLQRAKHQDVGDGPSPSARFRATVFNLTNSTVGAGILALPFVFKTCGIGFALILLLLGGILAAITLNMLREGVIRGMQF